MKEARRILDIFNHMNCIAELFNAGENKDIIETEQLSMICGCYVRADSKFLFGKAVGDDDSINHNLAHICMKSKGEEIEREDRNIHTDAAYNKRIRKFLKTVAGRLQRVKQILMDPAFDAFADHVQLSVIVGIYSGARDLQADTILYGGADSVYCNITHTAYLIDPDMVEVSEEE